MLENGLLPGLPADLISQAFSKAPGNELASGKFTSKESSSALVANAFGFFLDRPKALPNLMLDMCDRWEPSQVRLEAEMRFPWAGGRHPWLDAVIDTGDLLIGVESKRYEPYRPKKAPAISDAYFRDVWGKDMDRYGAVLRGLKSGAVCYEALDAAQLVKHAYGLRTCTHREIEDAGVAKRRAILLYLFAEPKTWPGGRDVDQDRIRVHRAEIMDFALRVSGDEVGFCSMMWDSLLSSWSASGEPEIADHAYRIREIFRP